MRLLILILILLAPLQSFAAWSVWTEPMLADKPQPAYNPGTKPTSVTLKGAKNEWVGFLVCVRGDESLVGFVPSVQSTLTKGADTIADSNLIPYILWNHNIPATDNIYELPGDWPDAAVPYRDVYFNELRNGTEAGWGQTVSSNTTRVFFVEIYIPTATVAGQYTGTFRLTSNTGALSQDLTITLDVWNFALPTQWTLKNAWGVYGNYWMMDYTAFGSRNDAKAREYLFNLQKAALNHGFFLHGGTGRYTSGPTTVGSFTDQYFDGASDTYSWKHFLDGDVPQGYNPKPYPKPSVWIPRDESGIALVYKTAATMDLWATWITTNNYDDTTFFYDKIYDEPASVAIIDSYHSAANDRNSEGHVARHTGYPDRPMELWTARGGSYPTDTAYWTDTFKSAWMIGSMYTWYRAHDWGDPYGSRADFSSREATYGDIVFQYTAGTDDTACNIDVYEPARGIRAAVAEAIDAYSRQNAYAFVSDWYFRTAGHHVWIVNEGWGAPTSTDNANQAWSDTSPFADTSNGAGVYFYPGRVSGSNYDIGGTNEIPIESYRLKLIRWGAQVYEYAKLLSDQGATTTADTQVGRMITFNVPNTITISAVSEWDAAREAMGDALTGGAQAQSRGTVPLGDMR